MKALTPKQQAVLAFLQERVQDGVPPLCGKFAPPLASNPPPRCTPVCAHWRMAATSRVKAG